MNEIPLNEIDLRIAFHLSTGNWPVWHPDSTKSHPKGETFRGKPKSIYAEWIEDLRGKNFVRRKYQLETGNFPVDEGKRGTYYYQSYIQWLEETSVLNEGVIKEIKTILNYK